MIEGDVQPHVQVCPECREEYGEDRESCPTCHKALCDPQDLERVGQHFGSYEITSILGVGGMGVVYKATHTTLLKLVAIKVLNERYGQRRDAAREMLREAQAASRIRHPHIVDVTDFGTTEEGAPYFVMEYLEGESLNELLARVGRLPVGRAVKMMQQAAGALAAAHRQGIVHRDLKPENIFLLDLTASDGTQPGDFIKILDFGLAKVLDMGPSSRTRAGMLAGTPWYMSPEQAQNRAVDMRSDIYSLGIVFYQMITGTVPFDGESAVDILMGHISLPVIQPYKYCRTIDEQTNRLIMRCLEKDPDLRHQSMEELAVALERCGTDLQLESGDILPELARGGAAAVGQSAPTVSSELVGQVMGSGQVNPTVSSELVGQVVGSVSRGPVNPTVENDLVQQLTGAPRSSVEEQERPREGERRLSAVVAPPSRKGRRGLRWALGAAAVAAAAVAVIIGVQQSGSTPASDQLSAAPAAPVAPQKDVRIGLEGVPREARVLLDGKLTGKRPLRVTRSGRRHTVRVEAVGYEPTEVGFVASIDQQLVFKLSPVKPDAGVERRRPRRRRTVLARGHRVRRSRRPVKRAAGGVAHGGDRPKEEPGSTKEPDPTPARVAAKNPEPTSPAKPKPRIEPQPEQVKPKPEPKPKPKPKTKQKKYRNWVVEPDI